MSADPEITPKVLLDHLQAMSQSLREEIRAVRADVRQVGERVDRVERNLTAQIDALDRRLDELEVQTLPRRVTALEAKVGR
jgi:predicted nuclease with TOPRIM domain